MPRIVIGSARAPLVDRTRPRLWKILNRHRLKTLARSHCLSITASAAVYESSSLQVLPLLFPIMSPFVVVEGTSCFCAVVCKSKARVAHLVAQHTHTRAAFPPTDHASEQHEHFQTIPVHSPDPSFSCCAFLLSSTLNTQQRLHAHAHKTRCESLRFRAQVAQKVDSAQPHRSQPSLTHAFVMCRRPARA